MHPWIWVTAFTDSDAVIGPTHLLYRSDGHDAAFWSAVAAGISAFTSLVGIVTTSISTWYSMRAARAAERANARVTQAIITLLIRPDTSDKLPHFPLHIENSGPGVAHVFRVWPCETMLISMGEVISPTSHQLFVTMSSLGHPIPVGGITELLLQNVPGDEDQTFIADWLDSAGNREQIHFRVFSYGGTLHLSVLGPATLLHEDMIRRRKRRQFIQRWQAKLPWFIYKHIKVSTTPE